MHMFKYGFCTLTIPGSFAYHAADIEDKITYIERCCSGISEVSYVCKDILNILSNLRGNIHRDIDASIPLILFCPSCGHRHIDTGEWETKLHHTHACQFCGNVWRPAVVNTVGVRFLPGFKNKVEP